MDGVGEAVHGLPVDGGGGVSRIGGGASRWCGCGDRVADRVVDRWLGGVDLWALVGASEAETHAANRAGDQLGSCWSLPTYYALNETKAAYENFETGSSVSKNGQWQPWSSERVETELAAGKPVFIDFTASWCLICQVNKKVATHTEATEALFEEHDVVALEADWTRYDSCDY